jgi:hypothetical protein
MESNEVLQRAEATFALKNNIFHEGTRAAPIGIMLAGESGIGKGHLIPYILRIHCEVVGRMWKRGLIYSRISSSQYWEGFLNLSMPYVFFPEVAKFSKAQVTSKGDNYLDELTQLIDSNTFRPDMAFADKGQVEATPEVVIADTNNPGLNAKHMYDCPGAYLRRFIYIVPTVLPAYRKTGSSAIDQEKSLGGEGHILDRYSFDVYTQRVTGSSTNKVYHLRGVRLAKLSSWLFTVFSRHRRDQGAIVERMDSAPIYYDDEKWRAEEK